MISRRRRLQNAVLEATGLRAPRTRTEEQLPRRFTWLPRRRDPRNPCVPEHTLDLVQHFGRIVVQERETLRATERRQQQQAEVADEAVALTRAHARTLAAAAAAPATPPPSPTAPRTTLIELGGGLVAIGHRSSAGDVPVALVVSSRPATDAASRDGGRSGVRHDAPAAAAESTPAVVVATPGRDQRGLTGGAAAAAATAVENWPAQRTGTPSASSTSASYGTPPTSIPSSYRRRVTRSAGTSRTAEAANPTPPARTRSPPSQAQRGRTGEEMAAGAAAAQGVGTRSSSATTVPARSSDSSSVFNPLIMFGEGATIRPEPAHAPSSQVQRDRTGGAASAAAAVGTRWEAQTMSDVAVSSGASTATPMPTPTRARRGTGDTTRSLNQIIAAFRERVNATPPVRIHSGGERRLVYPPLVIPVPTHIVWYHADELVTRMRNVMEGPSVEHTRAELWAVPLIPLPPILTPTPRGGDQLQARTRADELNRWVLARTEEVPTDQRPLPTDESGLSWACPMCQRLHAFPSPRRLATHMAARHLRRAIYMCGPCTTGEIFATYSSMRRHFHRRHRDSALD